MEFFAYMLSSLGLIGACMLVIVNLLEKTIKKKTKKLSSIAMRQTRESTSSRLIDTWAAHVGDDYQSFTHQGKLSAGRLLAQLEEKFQSLTYKIRECDWKGRRCNIIGQASKNGVEIMFSLIYVTNSVRDNEDRIKYYSSNFNVAEEEALDLSYSIEFIYAAGIPKTNEVVQEFERIVSNNEIECVVYPPVETERTATLYRVDETSLGDMYLSSFRMELATSSSNYLDAAYSKTEIKFGQEQAQLPMSSVVEVMKSTLDLGQNVSIFGAPGTGKTKLTEIMMLDLSKTKKVVVVPAAMMNELTQYNKLNRFIKMIKENTMDEDVVIFIDEAESLLAASENKIHSAATTLMLQLLDSTMSEEIKINFCLIFNTDPEKLDPALFRSGRMGMIVNLTAILAEQAQRLIPILGPILPGKIFDRAKFNSFLNEESALVDGTVYAKEGETSLADVFSCFVEQDHKALVVKLIREAAKKANPTPAPTAVNSKSPRLAPIGSTAPPTPAEAKVKAKVLPIMAPSAPRMATPSLAPTTKEVVAPTSAPHKSHKKDRRRGRK